MKRLIANTLCIAIIAAILFGIGCIIFYYPIECVVTVVVVVLGWSFYGMWYHTLANLDMLWK